ncbi:MAG: hypothetical protein EXS08_04130 [Planctomycetes bacterium]|nr:hypothetical protein [Planctomycetota bacterium]
MAARSLAPTEDVLRTQTLRLVASRSRIGAVSAQRILARTGVVLAGVVLALVAAELLVRALELGPSFQVLHRELFQLSANPVLGYELHPGASDGATTINSAGFRDREFALAKPAGVFRIVCVGDSVTFGQPKKSEESWPKALERLLNERVGTASFEVLNLGVTGYNVLQVAERLRILGLAYQPDLVLYGYVLNDPQELSIELEALRDLERASERQFHEGLERGALRLLANSRLFLWLASRVSTATPPKSGAVEFTHKRDPAFEAFQGGDTRGQYFRALHDDPAARARLGAGLDALAESTRAAGVPLALLIFPLLLDPRAGAYPLADVHTLVADEARARGFAVVDLAPALGACQRCAVDFLHPNAAGAELFAARAAAELGRLGLVPLPPAGR